MHNNVKIEVDVETYIDMLERRRDEFWVHIPNSVMNYYYDLLRDGCIPDPEHADPMYIVDNIAVNGDYTLVRDCYEKGKFIYLINESYNEDENTFNIYENMDEIEDFSGGGYAIVSCDMEYLTLQEAKLSLEDFMKEHSLDAYSYDEDEDDENKIILEVTATDDYIENDCILLENLFKTYEKNSLLGIKDFEIVEKNNLNYTIKVNCIPLPEDMYIIYSL